MSMNEHWKVWDRKKNFKRTKSNDVALTFSSAIFGDDNCFLYLFLPFKFQVGTNNIRRKMFVQLSFLEKATRQSRS